MILHPVAAFGPGNLKGRERVRVARALGRAALERSASLMNLELVELSAPRTFPRDEERAPLPFEHEGRTWHWSTTNTRGLSCAVVAPVRVGIDAEWLGRPRLAALLRYLSPGEIDRTGLEPTLGALSLWSAKEAALKLTGVGVAGMGRARLARVEGPGRLVIDLDDEAWQVQQVWEAAHVVSIACEARGFTAELDRFEEAQA